MKLTFFVHGVPRGAGSKHGFPIKKGGVYTGKVAMVDSSGEKGIDWRQSIVASCFTAMKDQAVMSKFTGPIELALTFYFPRPKSHYRTGKFSGELKKDAPEHHSVKPDATKCVRAVEDALNHIAWADDALVCEQHVAKWYSSKDVGCRVEIRDAFTTIVNDVAESTADPSPFKDLMTKLDPTLSI
jgi:Holliday junction resolvase RusA-like endonuclease